MSNHGSALRHGAAYLPSLPLDMKANNYEVADAGETITFKGVVKRSLSQAFFLVFVTAMSMVTLALVLNIQFNELGTWRFRPFDAVAIGDHFLTRPTFPRPKNSLESGNPIGTSLPLFRRMLESITGVRAIVSMKSRSNWRPMMTRQRIPYWCKVPKKKLNECGGSLNGKKRV